MSVSGSGIYFQVDIFGDRSSSIYVIDLAKDPVTFYSDPLVNPHGHTKDDFKVAADGSNIHLLELLSYDEPGNGITTFSLSGSVLSVTFSEAVGAITAPPIPFFHLVGRLRG